jgi:hypothetical protein
VSTLNEPVAQRIGKLFRRLASDFEGEQLNTVAAMKRLFASEGLSFSDIATVIENANGEIEELKYSDADAEIIFKRGGKWTKPPYQPGFPNHATQRTEPRRPASVQGAACQLGFAIAEAHHPVANGNRASRSLALFDGQA